MTIKEISDIESLIKSHGMQKAAGIIRESALNGNLPCQVFLSGAGLQIPKENRTKQIDNDIELFTKMAAEGGDAGSQFNLALIYTQKVDSSRDSFSNQDIDFLLKAKHWHGKAATQGFQASIQSLRNIKIALGEQQE